VLIKGGTHLEALGTVKAIAFDKTGTLTEGKPMVTEYCALHHLAAHAAAAHADGVCAACNDVLALAAAVERRTSHPLARGVVEAAQHHDLSAVYPAAEAVEILAGKGVQGTVNGRLITVGNHALFDMDYPHHAEVCQHIEQLEARGHTAMMIADAGQVCGYITLADAPRASSQAAIAELNALGLTTIMLTGDNATVAHAVGAAVGVRDVRAGLLPADKVTAIRDLMTTHQGVAMIGDGVNDTPALATATVGIAMGGAGSSQALEVADVALMADDLSQLPFAIRVSRFARRLIRNNVLLSFGLKAAFLALALFGLTSLWVAIFADVGMSLAVTLNGMRPLAFERNR
jgi:Cd2+/Zn2+-exporting ATPase